MAVSTGQVTTINKSGSAPLSGPVTLSAGTGATLTQSGQNIEIAASGGGSGASIGLIDALKLPGVVY